MTTATEIEMRSREAFWRYIVPAQLRMRRVIWQGYRRLVTLVEAHLADEEMQLQRWADDGGPVPK